VISDIQKGKNDDLHHWAFFIFEDLRRKLKKLNLPLLTVFNLKNND
jgi:hypothetical protein